MLEVVSWFVIFFITHILDCYVFSKLVKEKFKINLKLIVLCLIISVIDSLFIKVNNILKIIFGKFITFLLLKIIYNKSNSKTFIGAFFTIIGYAVAELIYAAILYLIILNLFNNYLLTGITNIIVSNILIFIIYIIFYNIPFFVNLFNSIVEWLDDKKYLSVVINCILAMVVLYILLGPFYFNNLNKSYLVIIYATLVGIIVFIIGFFKEKSDNNKLTIEFSQLLDYVKTYENEVVEKGKNQHEYKNQLVTLDDMIPNSNKKAKEYISKILNRISSNKENDWLLKLKSVPSGGIKGLIHFKIQKMIENKISVFVYVDKSLSKKDSWVNIEKNLEDITRVLGVYLDNAIEAASISKDKQIIIEFNDNNESIEFKLSNTYSGNINIEEIDKEGYSTKGKGRGVGLSLVKDIIENNKILNQKREIDNRFFIQKLYIKK